MTEHQLPLSPLHDTQERGTVAFGDVDGWLMPCVFENIKMEYLGAKGTVAVMDRSNCGRLRVAGAKRYDLLNRLTTNDLRSIGPGQGTATVLLTDKGRIIDDMRLYAREDFYYLVTAAGNSTRVKEAIEKLRFRDDVTLQDVTAGTAMISLFGPQSSHLLEWVTRAKHLDRILLHHSVDLEAGGVKFLAARTADVGATGFNLILPAEGAGIVWDMFLDQGQSHGVTPLGEEAYEMLRIESGVPRFGRELTDDYNPLEAGLNDRISFTKGCYVGQEVVARLDSRSKISKLLAGLWLAPGQVPEAGSGIESAGRPGLRIGTLTSVAPSLDFRRVIGLGYVRTDLAQPGTRLVVVSGEDRCDADVAALPFTLSGVPGPR